MMRGRYDEDAEYHRGHRGKPSNPRWLIVLDEVQEIRRVLGKKVLDPFLQQISRQVRAANGRLVVVTQRPDTEDAIPGAVRDMLEDRIFSVSFPGPARGWCSIRTGRPSPTTTASPRCPVADWCGSRAG